MNVSLTISSIVILTVTSLNSTIFFNVILFNVADDEKAFLVVANYINIEVFDLTEHLHRYNTRSNVPRKPLTATQEFPANRVTMLDVNVHNKTICYVSPERNDYVALRFVSFLSKEKKKERKEKILHATLTQFNISIDTHISK